MTLLLISMAAVFGLVIGSFLNALAYRLPTGESLMTRSHCTSCGKQITAWENVPVLSWLVLRGKCSKCKSPISIQYPLVELFVGLSFAGVMWTATRIAPPIDSTLATIAAALPLFTFVFIGVLSGLIDAKTMTIPTKVIWWGFAVALASTAFYAILTGDWQRVLIALLTAAVISLIYFTFFIVREGSVGFGDVRLSVVSGLVLGFISLGTAVLGFFLPWFLAAIWLLPSIVKKQVTMKHKLPFGPWLVLGTILALVFGDIVTTFYLQLGSY